MVATDKSFQLNKICHRKHTKGGFRVKSDKLNVALNKDKAEEGQGLPQKTLWTYTGKWLEKEWIFVYV